MPYYPPGGILVISLWLVAMAIEGVSATGFVYAVYRILNGSLHGSFPRAFSSEMMNLFHTVFSLGVHGLESSIPFFISSVIANYLQDRRFLSPARVVNSRPSYPT